MYQYWSSVCTRRFSRRFFCRCRTAICFSLWIVVFLIQSQGPVFADTSEPVWAVPVRQTSTDGYAFIDWFLPKGETADVYRITEIFQGREEVSYVEQGGLRVFRVNPGKYKFGVQACDKGPSGLPMCGNESETLTLNVGPGIFNTLLTADHFDTTGAAENTVTDLGPESLRPGHWYNPSKEGHGWSFYWANRLALPEDDPLFGNVHDLVGIWYTFEAKSASLEPDCPSCPPITGTYRPVVVTFKAVLTGANTYGGALYISRNGGERSWVGGADVTFAPENTSAMINWSASFSKEALSDTDPLYVLLGSDPDDVNNISHFSGVWNAPGEESFFLVEDIGQSVEVMSLVFHDESGDASWIQGVVSGIPESVSQNICMAYLVEGYSPQSDKMSTWVKQWHMSGCDASKTATSANRNARRYFSGLDTEFIWIDFELPGIAHASGSVTIGRSNAPVSLNRGANFHGVNYENSSGPSCELGEESSFCEVQLTWFTDGDYPSATVFAYNATTRVRNMVLTSVTPVMSDINFSIFNPGLYHFELRMGNDTKSTLIAKSSDFVVTQTTINSPPVLSMPEDQVNSTGDFVDLQLFASDPDVDDVLGFTAIGLPQGLSINTSNGRISGILSGPDGVYQVSVSVHDDHGGSASGSFNWMVSVIQINRPPTIDSPADQVVTRGTEIKLELAVDDADDDNLSCDDNGSLPTGLAVAINTEQRYCVISGTIVAAVGNYDSVITVADNTGAASAYFSWRVLAGNSNPEQPPEPAVPPSMTASVISSRVGATVAEFRVDEAGSATFILPILTAVSSGGVRPAVTLNYSSQADTGLAGVGWSLNAVSTITRCPRTVEQDGITGSRAVLLDFQDRFCLDGQRLFADPSSGAYGKSGTRYRTEIDNFSRITSFGSAGNGPAWFRLEQRDGTVVEYGNSPDSRIEARGSDVEGTVLIWTQNRSQDSSGNYMIYSYLENDTGPVSYALRAIDYTGNTRASSLPSARISFEYANRSPDSDLTFRSIAGTRVERRHLLQNIRSQGRIVPGGTLEDLRYYALEYEEDGFGRNIISSVTECRSESRSICYQPTRFDWLKSSHTVDSSGLIMTGLLPEAGLNGLQVADVSGDGRPDLLYVERIKRHYYLKVKTAAANAAFSEWASRYELPRNSDGLPPQLFGIDVNHDGIEDVVYAKYSDTSDDYSWVTLVSSGSAFSAETFLNPTFRFYLNDQGLESRVRIMDFNGDGLSDILHVRTDVLGAEWLVTVLLNLTSDNEGIQFSEPIELNMDNADLFPVSTDDGWEMSMRPPFYKWGNAGVMNMEVPDARVFDFDADGATDMLFNIFRQYQRCIENCVPNLSTSGNKGGKGGKTPDPVYEFAFASLWVVMLSNGQDEFVRQGIVALGADCTVPAVCDNPVYRQLPVINQMIPVDINADGLSDLAWADPGNTWYYQLNTGRNYETAQRMGQVPVGVKSLVRIQDWNGDHFPDLIFPSVELDDYATWIIVQNHFGREFAAPFDTGVSTGNVGGKNGLDPVENDVSVLVDFNGDGKNDQLFIDNRPNGEILSTRLHLGINANGNTSIEPSNMITRITTGLGAVTEIEYKPMTDPNVYTRLYNSNVQNWGKGSSVYDFIAPIYVVSQVSSSAPTFANRASVKRIQYHYVGAKLQAGGRGLLGFAEIIGYDPQKQIRTNIRYRQDFPFTGQTLDTTVAVDTGDMKFSSVTPVSSKLTQTWPEVNAGLKPPATISGTLLSYGISQWSDAATAPDTRRVEVVASLQLKFTLSGHIERRVLTQNDHDVIGNLSRSVVTTFARDDTEPFSQRTIDNEWSAPILENWDMGNLSTSTVRHVRAGHAPVVRRSRFNYDPVTSILIGETIEPGHPTLQISTTYALDKFGNRLQTSKKGVGMDIRSQRVSYDSLGRFVVRETNALGEVTRQIRDGSWDVFGNPLKAENIDGLVTTLVVDLMGRPFAHFNLAGVWQKTLFFLGAGDECPAQSAWFSQTISGTGSVEYQCFDLLGRNIRSVTNSLNNKMIFTDQYYDLSGQSVRVSEPYFKGEGVYWNESAFDRLDRISGLLSAGGDDLTTDYDEQATNACTMAGPGVAVTTNALGQQTVAVKNVLGELIESYDDQCGRVTFDHDSMGNLVLVTGADATRVRMTYDGAGRKIAQNDPDKGNWHYAYNALGELTRQLDSQQQAIDFEYDDLGRVTHRRELQDVDDLSDAGYITVNHEVTTHRSISPGKSQVSKQVYFSGESGPAIHQREIGFDSLGRVNLVSSTIGSKQFAERTTYDEFGRIFQHFDASGDDRGLRYIYQNGRLRLLKEAREGVNGTVYQEILVTDARGNVTMAELGNGVIAVAEHDAPSGRLTRLSAYDRLGVELQKVDYLFDVLGNLKQKYDRSGVADLREEYQYDQLNRLDRVQLTAISLGISSPVETLALTYDEAGNITWKSDVGTYSYGTGDSGPHAVTRAGGVSYSYDANGNQTDSDFRTITYSIFDKATRLTSGNKSTSFSYGIGNKRQVRLDSEADQLNKTTTYLGSVEFIVERGESSYFKRYISGVAIATFYPATSDQKIAYLLKDHLGSIHSVVDETARVSTRMRFSPFGERQGSDLRTVLDDYLYVPLNDFSTRGFTGHEHVDSMGIINMNGRIYDAGLGRFLQADPFVQAPGNSQSWNRYTYVFNNPLSYTDPSGYFGIGRFIKKWGRLIAAITASIYLPGAQGLLATQLGVSGAFSQFVITGFVAGGIAGGIRGAVRGAFLAAATYGISQAFNPRAAGSTQLDKSRLTPSKEQLGHMLGTNNPGAGLYQIQVGEYGEFHSAAAISAEDLNSLDTIFTNGMSNNFQDAVRNGSTHIAQLDGAASGFVLNFNPTRSLGSDLLESTRDLAGTYLGFGHTELAENLAHVIDTASRNGITGLRLIGHSQGAAITTSALRFAADANLDISSLASVNLHGGPVNDFFVKNSLARRTGLANSQFSIRAQFGDAVHGIVGANFISNPLRLPVSVIRVPHLFSTDATLSPHTVPCPVGRTAQCPGG